MLNYQYYKEIMYKYFDIIFLVLGQKDGSEKMRTIVPNAEKA